MLLRVTYIPETFANTYNKFTFLIIILRTTWPIQGPIYIVHKFCYLSIYLSIYLSVCLSIYGSTVLVGLGRFFSFLMHTQSVGLLGRGISPSQGRYLHTEQHKHRINAHRYSCLEWNSNPWSQCSSGPRRFMPWTARPLWSEDIVIINVKFVYSIL
jgi:hypothetical protein